MVSLATDYSRQEWRERVTSATDAVCIRKLERVSVEHTILYICQGVVTHGPIVEAVTTGIKIGSSNQEFSRHNQGIKTSFSHAAVRSR